MAGVNDELSLDTESVGGRAMSRASDAPPDASGSVAPPQATTTTANENIVQEIADAIVTKDVEMGKADRIPPVRSPEVIRFSITSPPLDTDNPAAAEKATVAAATTENTDTIRAGIENTMTGSADPEERPPFNGDPQDNANNHPAMETTTEPTVKTQESTQFSVSPPFDTGHHVPTENAALEEVGRSSMAPVHGTGGTESGGMTNADSSTSPSGSQETHSRNRRSEKMSYTATRSVDNTPVVMKMKVGVPGALSAEDQLKVDHHDDEHTPLLPGARVFGQYKKSFYPAIVCGTEGINRYTIRFAEDGVVKTVPYNGLFQLSKLAPGVITTISPSPDDLGTDTVGRRIKVIAVPDRNNAVEWKEGLFKVRDVDSAEEIIVLWTQFYFFKQDAEDLKPKNPITMFDQGPNAMPESRSIRQSRADRTKSTDATRKLLGGSTTTVVPMACRGRSSMGVKGYDKNATSATVVPMACRSRPSVAKKEEVDRAHSTSGSSSAELDNVPGQQLKRRIPEESCAAEPAVGCVPASKKAKTDFTEELDAVHQLEVDFARDVNNLLLPGARVFGQYKTSFYPAIVYRVHADNSCTIRFIEDGVTTTWLRSRIFRLSEIKPGLMMKISPSPDDRSPATIGREVEVVTTPDENNAVEWKDGKFKVRDVATTEEITAVWTQFYFHKEVAERLLSEDVANSPADESPSSSRRTRTTTSHGASQHTSTLATMDLVGRRSSRVTQATHEAHRKALQPIFDNRKFVLTSTKRTEHAGGHTFNKLEIGALIEKRGGTIISDFTGVGDDDEVYLVTDRHHRTLKYLSALSLSVPCVRYTWITECVNKDKFLDFNEHVLPAGQVRDHDGVLHDFAWKPLKGQLMAGKKVWIHSKDEQKTPKDDLVLNWTPVMRAIGAEVVLDDALPQSKEDLVQWIGTGGFDILLTDPTCEPHIVHAVEASGVGAVVGIEWVVDALISAELPDTSLERYRYDA